MGIKIVASPQLKIDKEGRVFEDDRKFFKFTLPDGRVAETKALTKELARAMVENTLDIELKEAA